MTERTRYLAGTGRSMSEAPRTGTTAIVARGIPFKNGAAFPDYVSGDEITAWVLYEPPIALEQGPAREERWALRFHRRPWRWLQPKEWWSLPDGKSWWDKEDVS